MKRVLVIAYYFPPMGLSGVQRIAGFVRHLPEYGWQPTVLTVEPAGYFAYDESLLQDVEAAGVRIVRTRSLDPTRVFKRRSVVSMPKETSRQRFALMSDWVFAPDNKIGWMPFALAAGKRILKENAFDAILSSAPPYTAHLIGANLSEWANLPLVLDFRDDWVGNPRLQFPTRLHKSHHLRLERKVVRQSSTTITINNHIRDALQERNDGLKVDVIPHGHDFANHEVTSARRDGKLQLLYTGVFYDAQTPDYFLRGLAEFLSSCKDAKGRVEAIFAGLIPESSQMLVRNLGLSGVVKHVGYLPHDATVRLQQQADVLWMTIGTRPGSEGISTGKLFEYIGQRKPVLALVPDGTAKDTLHQYQAAFVVPPENVPTIANTLVEVFTRWSNGMLPKPNEAFVESLSRRTLTRKLAHLITSCL